MVFWAGSAGVSIMDAAAPLRDTHNPFAADSFCPHCSPDPSKKPPPKGQLFILYYDLWGHVSQSVPAARRSFSWTADIFCILAIQNLDRALHSKSMKGNFFLTRIIPQPAAVLSAPTDNGHAFRRYPHAEICLPCTGSATKSIDLHYREARKPGKTADKTKSAMP